MENKNQKVDELWNNCCYQNKEEVPIDSKFI